MSRGNNLVKNTGILAIGKLSARIFTFLLLPLYTKLLSTDDYGTVDVLQTVISLSLYIVSLQIDAAIFRFIIESRKNTQKQIDYLSCSVFVYLTSAIIFTVLIILCGFFWTIPHKWLLILCYWSNSFSNIMQGVMRGYGHNGMYSLVSMVITLIALVVNVILIAGFHLGGETILFALFFSNLVGGVWMFFYEKMWVKIKLSSIKIDTLKELLRYSVPLIPNAVSWWIVNVSDKLLIFYFCGSHYNGIYAAANKIPAIYTTIFTVFNLAWTENVTLAMTDSDRDNYFNRIIQTSYRMFSFLVVEIICFTSLFFKMLIGENYYSSYPHIFILLIAVFLNSMCSMYGGIFIGFKDSKNIGMTTLIGAIANVMLNFIFIHRLGLFAASISTLISYLIVLIIRRLYITRMIKLQSSITLFVQMILAFVISGFAYFYNNMVVTIFIMICILVWGIYVNWNIVIKICKSFMLKMKKQ